MSKEKITDFLKRLCFSSFILWFFLIVLNRFNLKPAINIDFFLFFSFLLFLILYLRQILILSNFVFSKINSSSDFEKTSLRLLKNYQLTLLLFRQLLIFLKKLPLLIKNLLRNRFFWLGLAFGGIFLDIFVFKFTSDLLILILTGVWISVIRRFGFEGRDSVKVALGFLVLCPILLIFNKEAIAEKAAIWVYMFLVVGVIQMMINELTD